MDLKGKVTLLKKLEVLKAYLILDDISNSETVSIFETLFIDNVKTIFESKLNLLKVEIDSNNTIAALNLLNELRENISQSIFKNPCQKNFNDLIDTNDTNIKYCSDCSKHVFLVSNEEELIKRRNLRQCVAINTLDISEENIPKNFRSCLIKHESKPIHTIGYPSTA